LAELDQERNAVQYDLDHLAQMSGEMMLDSPTPPETNRIEIKRK